MSIIAQYKIIELSLPCCAGLFKCEITAWHYKRSHTSTSLFIVHYLHISSKSPKRRYEFGVNKNLTMVSYCPKKAKAVILLSSMHNDKSVDDGEKKKTQIILNYKTKGGVDVVNQMVRNFLAKG